MVAKDRKAYQSLGLFEPLALQLAALAMRRLNERERVT